MKTRYRLLVTALLSCTIIMSLQPHPAYARECQNTLSPVNASVTRVVDGDTIVLDSNQRVRIIGIDTQEAEASDPADRLWAGKATNMLDTLVGGKQVILLSGRERKDRYDRLLAHVRLADGRDVAATLISHGLAIAVGVGLNTACADANLQLEQQARTEQLGLWKDKGDWWSGSEQRFNARRGFHVVRSTVTGRAKYGRKTQLTLANGLRIRLANSWPLNAPQTDKLMKDVGQQNIEVRGWISGALASPELTLHHPANLQKVSVSVNR